MTVSISAKHDVHDMSKSKTDSNDNDTCYNDRDCVHTGGLVMRRSAKQPHKRVEVDNKEGTSTPEEKIICSFKDAPTYVKHNNFILSGYRGMLNTQQCMESIFWWTNETINIWSHLFGFVLFIGVSIRDMLSLELYAHFLDIFILAFVLICFQICMLLSSLYHTFSCRSARDFDVFLGFDLFGIAMSLYAIYVSGIYYAFWCNPWHLNFYVFSVTVIFAIAMLLHVPRFNVDANVKMMVFVAWAAYGVLPTVHWAIHYGWFKSSIVRLLLPRVIGMYAISGSAFFIYITKLPERFCKGKFDYFGHSHQWWHVLVLVALYYWHCTGMVYLEYRYNHACCPSQTNLM